jgi:hypothetical protein
MNKNRLIDVFIFKISLKKQMREILIEKVINKYASIFFNVTILSV